MKTERFDSKVFKLKSHPQYCDDSQASKEYQACIKVIDALIDLEAAARGIGLPQDLRSALKWCNSRATFIMDELD